MNWDKVEYEEEFYKWCAQEKFEISEENRTALKPLIEQACENEIGTVELFNIVKGSVKNEG